MADVGTLARPYARAGFELARADGSLSVWSAALAPAAVKIACRGLAGVLSAAAVGGAK